jgi:actin-related protein
MTDSSMTLAPSSTDGNKASLERQRQQRAKMCEIAFEKLGIKNFGLVPSQAPQIFSEMLHTGYVVDFGHEMTQIVPI